MAVKAPTEVALKDVLSSLKFSLRMVEAWSEAGMTQRASAASRRTKGCMRRTFQNGDCRSGPGRSKLYLGICLAESKLK